MPLKHPQNKRSNGVQPSEQGFSATNSQPREELDEILSNMSCVMCTPIASTEITGSSKENNINHRGEKYPQSKSTQKKYSPTILFLVTSSNVLADL